MLVLTRKQDQKILIEGGIVVTIVKIGKDQVRLGITAPPEVQVFREEICPESLNAQFKQSSDKSPNIEKDD